MRQRGGGIVTCAGEAVTLLAATHYVVATLPALTAQRRASAAFNENQDVVLTALLAAHAQRVPEIESNFRASIIGKATCDAQGRFAFNGIAPGAYVVFTGVTWMAGDERQGGPMEQGVTVSPGENNVILSQ